MEEWRDDREDWVPRVGEAVVAVDLTILFFLRCSEVAPARRAVLCQAALPASLFCGFIMRLNVMRVSAVSGKRLTVIVVGGLSGSSSTLSWNTDNFGFLWVCVLSKSGLNAVKECAD